MEYLWPEANPGAAARGLLVVIHDLRRGLSLASPRDCPFILSEGGSYHFNTQAPYRLDVDEFLRGIKRGEDLQAQGNRQGALEIYRPTAQLYQGDFLGDECYNDWCSVERERLREIYLILMEKIASLLAEDGDLEGSVRYLQQALLIDNLREAVHRQLMGYLWQAGRSDEALRQYSLCKKVLAQELGVRPLKETEDLYLRMLKERGGGIKPKI
jgi:DNA-binding SARP family transcriptional activator